MNIAFITPEVFPFSKTGGLGDVAHALSATLASEGCEITVFTPGYRSVLEWFEYMPVARQDLVLPEKLWIGDEQHPVVVRLIEHEGVRLCFIFNGYYYDRPHPYVDESEKEYADNVSRFSFLCRAVLEYLLFTGSAPDVFHVHDWQAALIPLYLKSIYNKPEFALSRSLLTLHNLGYQGVYPAQQIYATGLGWEWFSPKYLEYYGDINLLKAGIVTADAINTVSPNYAKEVQTEEQGKGLHGVLQSQKHKLSGILNGINMSIWDPATDPLLPANYSHRALSGKARCKKVLQHTVGLPARADTLLLGVVSRFDVQKGIDLIAAAFPLVANLDLQLVVLGSGTNGLEDAMRQLATAFPQQVGLRLGYDEALAHLIEAGADAFLMPSSYEPCGLNQMYSQRYGTLPIVRETGGLKDTVSNATPKRIADGEASGFTFRQYDPQKLADAIRRAARMFHNDRKSWRNLVQHIMKRDFSWERSAQAYMRIYEHLARHARPARQEVQYG